MLKYLGERHLYSSKIHLRAWGCLCVTCVCVCVCECKCEYKLMYICKISSRRLPCASMQLTRTVHCGVIPSCSLANKLYTKHVSSQSVVPQTNDYFISWAWACLCVFVYAQHAWWRLRERPKSLQTLAASPTVAPLRSLIKNIYKFTGCK